MCLLCVILSKLKFEMLPMHPPRTPWTALLFENGDEIKQPPLLENMTHIRWAYHFVVWFLWKICPWIVEHMCLKPVEFQRCRWKLFGGCCRTTLSLVLGNFIWKHMFPEKIKFEKERHSMEDGGDKCQVGTQLSSQEIYQLEPILALLWAGI